MFVDLKAAFDRINKSIMKKKYLKEKLIVWY